MGHVGRLNAIALVSLAASGFATLIVAIDWAPGSGEVRASRPQSGICGSTSCASWASDSCHPR
jgi:hypothetical protein